MVVDDRFGLVHQAVRELRHQRFDGDLVHRRLERDARHDVAEGDDLAQLRRLPRQAIVHPPEEVHGVPEKGAVVVHRDRVPADHADRGIVEMRQESVDRALLDHDVGADHEQDRRPRRGNEDVDRRRLAFAALLHDQPEPRLACCDVSNDRRRRIGASAGYDDEFLDMNGGQALPQNRVNRDGNIRLLVVRHDADAACQRLGADELQRL